MKEKEFEDYIDTEYPSIVRQFIKKSPRSSILILAFISTSLYILHFITCRGCGEYEQLVNDWATPLGVFGGFYLFAAYLYLEKKVKKYYTIIGQLTDLDKESYQNFYERFIALAFRSQNMVLFCLVLIIIFNIIFITMGLWYDTFLANFWLLIEMNVTVIGGGIGLLVNGLYIVDDI